MFSSILGLYSLNASDTTPFLDCDNQNCLQTLLYVLWGWEKLQFVENHWLRAILSIEYGHYYRATSIDFDHLGPIFLLSKTNKAKQKIQNKKSLPSFSFCNYFLPILPEYLFGLGGSITPKKAIFEALESRIPKSAGGSEKGKKKGGGLSFWPSCQPEEKVCLK